MSTTSESVFGAANGLLEVYISRARDLPNLRKLDKQSPFVRLRLAHLTETSEVVPRGGQTPRFNFYASFDLTPDVKPTLLVELFDDKSPPRLIGQCEVDLTPALYKDPEDGHDDWYQLYFGAEEAGEVYMELTFHPVIPTNRAHHGAMDGNSEFEASLASRPPPPLPSVIPSVQLRPSSNRSGENNSHFGGRYLHASRLQQQTPSIKQTASFQETPSSTTSYNFSSSMTSNATSDSHNSQSSHSTINTTGTTEPLFAKLKQLKEKWRSIKNPNTDQLEQEHKVDLRALQKIVGVPTDDGDSDRPDARRPSRRSEESKKFITQPPLPQLPRDCSRMSSSESSPSRTSRTDSRVPHLSPRLPPLPSSPSFTRKSSSLSPTRRRPPPLS